MIESQPSKSRSRYLRGCLTIAAVTGGLMTAAYLDSSSEKTCALKAGDSIECVPMVDLKIPSQPEEIILKADQATDGAGIVYFQNISQRALRKLNDKNPNDAAGLLLTEHAGKARVSLIAYNRRTKVAEMIGKSTPIKTGVENVLFSGVNTNQTEFYEALVKPTGDREGSIVLDYESVSISDQQQPKTFISASPDISV